MERLYIIKAENAGNLTVSLTISDNTVQTVDIGEFFDKRSGKAERSRFTIENGNIVWGKNWDLFFPVEQLHAGAVI